MSQDDGNGFKHLPVYSAEFASHDTYFTNVPKQLNREEFLSGTVFKRLEIRPFETRISIRSRIKPPPAEQD